MPPGESRPDNNNPKSWAIAIGSLLLVFVVLAIATLIFD